MKMGIKNLDFVGLIEYCCVTIERETVDTSIDFIRFSRVNQVLC